MKKVRKTFIDFTKEEAWLNQMGAQGFKLVDYKGYYLFEEGKEHYQYKIDVSAYLYSKDDYQDFLHFLEGMDIEMVASYFGRTYLRRLARKEAFEIYTDFPSQLAQLRRIS